MIDRHQLPRPGYRQPHGRPPRRTAADRGKVLALRGTSAGPVTTGVQTLTPWATDQTFNYFGASLAVPGAANIFDGFQPGS